MMLVQSGRRAGKSIYALSTSMILNDIQFMKMGESIVDEEQWYTVMVLSEAYEWLCTQDSKMAYETVSQYPTMSFLRFFEVHEKIFTTLLLKFQ